MTNQIMKVVEPFMVEIMTKLNQNMEYGYLPNVFIKNRTTKGISIDIIDSYQPYTNINIFIYYFYSLFILTRIVSEYLLYLLYLLSCNDVKIKQWGDRDAKNMMVISLYTYNLYILYSL